VIICRTPFRISFFGGGTDFPEWYKSNSGMVISATINKYCFVILRTLPPYFKYKYRVRYFKNEHARTIEKIRHPSVKAILKKFHKSNDGLEIVHNADLPAQSGLGASSAFTVSLINAMSNYNEKFISKRHLAQESINVEQNLLREYVGSQDQFACAFGGLNIIDFKKSGNIDANPIVISKSKVDRLRDHTLLFFTGFPREAQIIEQDKLKKLKKNYNNLKTIYQIAQEAKQIIYSQNNNSISELGKLLNESWKFKKQLSNKVSNKTIDEIYDIAIKNGALGGKILGAGGGGFMLFIVKNTQSKKLIIKKLRRAKNLEYDFDFTGSQIIYYKK